MIISVNFGVNLETYIKKVQNVRYKYGYPGKYSKNNCTNNILINWNFTNKQSPVSTALTKFQNVSYNARNVHVKYKICLRDVQTFSQTTVIKVTTVIEIVVTVRTLSHHRKPYDLPTLACFTFYESGQTWNVTRLPNEKQAREWLWFS